MSKLKHRNLASFLSLILLGTALSLPAMARPYNNGDTRDEPQKLTTIKPAPNTLKDFQELKKNEPIVGDKGKGDGSDKLENVVKEEKDLALKIRRDAMKEAALSFGARGGLAWRTKEIMDRLNMNKAALDKAFDFRRLLIKAPSNMFIEPPIISEALNNFVVTNDGGEAAVADTVYHISRQARIVSTPRNWRQYLERDAKEVVRPPDILLPENDDERKAWRIWTAQGWTEGYKQAEEIFQADLNRMVADFEGMVRYRILLSQKKVSAPYATLEDRGISGKEIETQIGNREVKITNEMRVGDRAIRITEPVSLRTGEQGEEWQPPVRAQQ